LREYGAWILEMTVGNMKRLEFAHHKCLCMVPKIWQRIWKTEEVLEWHAHGRLTEHGDDMDYGLTLEKSLMTDHCGEAMSPSVEGLRSCSHYTLICTDMRVSAHLSKTLTTFTLCACLRRSALHWVWRVLKVWGNRVGTLDLCALMTWVAALHCNN